MHKLKITLEQNQFPELLKVYSLAFQRIRSELSIGQYCIGFDLLMTMIKRTEKLNHMNGLTRKSFTMYVYHWETCLLFIAKSKIKPDPYNSITINEITEKLFLFNRYYQRTW